MPPIFQNICPQSPASSAPFTSSCPPVASTHTLLPVCDSGMPLLPQPSTPLTPPLRSTGEHAGLKEQTENHEKKQKAAKALDDPTPEWKKKEVEFIDPRINELRVISITVSSGAKGTSVKAEDPKSPLGDLKLEALFFSEGHLYRSDGTCLGRFGIAEDRRTNFAKDDLIVSNGTLQRADGRLSFYNPYTFGLDGEGAVYHVIVNAPPPRAQTPDLIRVLKPVSSKLIEDSNLPGHKMLTSQAVRGYEAVWITPSELAAHPERGYQQFNGESNKLAADAEAAFRGKKPEEKVIHEWKPGIDLRRSGLGYSLEIRRVAALNQFSAEGLSLAEGNIEVVNISPPLRDGPVLPPPRPLGLPNEPVGGLAEKTDGKPGSQPESGKDGERSVPLKKREITKDDAKRIAAGILMQQVAELTPELITRLRCGEVAGTKLTDESDGRGNARTAWTVPARPLPNALRLEDGTPELPNGPGGTKTTTANVISEFRNRVPLVAAALGLGNDPEVKRYLERLNETEKEIEKLDRSPTERVKQAESLLLRTQAETLELGQHLSGRLTADALTGIESDKRRQELAGTMREFLDDAKYQPNGPLPATIQDFQQMAKEVGTLRARSNARLNFPPAAPATPR